MSDFLNPVLRRTCRCVFFRVVALLLGFYGEEQLRSAFKPQVAAWVGFGWRSLSLIFPVGSRFWGWFKKGGHMSDFFLSHGDSSG